MFPANLLILLQFDYCVYMKMKAAGKDFSLPAALL